MREAFVIVLDDMFYTGKPGINEVEPVFSSELVRAKLYGKIEEANYIRGAMHVLGRFVEVVPVSIKLGVVE